jgi:hypothetical protein
MPEFSHEKMRSTGYPTPRSDTIAANGESGASFPDVFIEYTNHRYFRTIGLRFVHVRQVRVVDRTPDCEEHPG